MKRGLSGLAAYLWRHRIRVGLGLFCLLLADVVQLYVPLVSQQVIDALTKGQATHAFLRNQGLKLAGLALVCYAARYWWRRLMFTAARLAEVDLRRRILDRVLSLPQEYYQKTRTGEVMALATNDLLSVRMALAFGLMSSFDAVVYSALTITALFYLDPQLAMMTLVPFPLLAVLMLVFMQMNYKLWDTVQSSFEDLTEKARESLAGMRVLRAYCQEQGDTRDFVRICQTVMDRFIHYVKIDALFSPAVLILAGGSTTILLAMGGQRVVSGETSLGTFAAFASYLGQLTWPMIAAGWTVSLVQRGAASMNRIQTLLSQPVEPDQASLGVLAEGRLEARSLSFTYPGSDRPALTDLSFSLESGGTLGIVGEVGSGKSTLAALLMRFYEPERGCLWLDGQDLCDYNLTELRQRIAWVPQDSFLFSEAISANLRLGLGQVEQEALERASRLASLHAEVEEFPQGYATELGERGVTLSGGQKQRVCLARALLKSAPILILDDTLSAVDAHTEHEILNHLHAHMSGRTTLVISHRISSVKDLDEILVLDEGRVLQRGTHEELVRTPGLYQEMYELQRLEA